MRAGGRFGATSCVRRCLVYRRHRASSCRRANPIEPGWRRQRLLEVFLAGAAIWRTGCHRRTLLICLHACAGRYSAQPNLRHIESRPRLPCPCGGGFPNRSNIPQSRCNTCSRRCLSSERPSMDQAEWRFDTKTYLSSRPSTRGIISALLATPVMDKRERLRTLAAKLTAIEQDRHAELAAGEGGSEPIAKSFEPNFDD